jgi:glycosyltransferase involved in cell wall biosynthesis
MFETTTKRMQASIEWRYRKILALARIKIHNSIHLRKIKSKPILGIIDFLYPVRDSSFCNFEYGYYLTAFGADRFASIWTGSGYQNPDGVGEFFDRLARSSMLPELNFFSSPKVYQELDGFYSIWFSCLAAQLGTIRKPFSLTLYPDEGWQPESPDSLRKLDKILNHPGFKTVLCTQYTTLDFVRSKFGNDNRIKFLHGVALSLPSAQFVKARRGCRANTDRLKILIGGRMNTESLKRQKGFFIALDAARILKRSSLPFSLTVVGTEPGLKPPTELADTCKFIPFLNSNNYQELLLETDIFWSPNSGWRDNGSFDGFPTGAAIEAGASGCVVITSDTLGEHVHTGLPQGALELSDLSGESFAERTIALADTEKLEQRKNRAIDFFQEKYSADQQMPVRLSMIQALLNS